MAFSVYCQMVDDYNKATCTSHCSITQSITLLVFDSIGWLWRLNKVAQQIPSDRDPGGVKR